MSRAEVIEFLKGFSHRDIASVWRPGLDDWKPATQLFDIVLPERWSIRPIKYLARDDALFTDFTLV
jgi:hypothetical protein